MPQALPPKSVLVVDDPDVHSAYTSHSELGGNVHCIPDWESAISYLETLEPSEFPEVLIVDCMPPTEGDIGNPFLGSFWKASRCGDLYARRMIEVYREKGAKLPHVLFKSADESIAHKAFKNLVNL